MDINTILALIWIVIALCLFALLMMGGRYKTHIRLWEFVIIALILSALWPAELCIAGVMLPFYPIHLIRQRINKKNKSVPTNVDDDEPDPLLTAEEHPDWTDGITEYEE